MKLPGEVRDEATIGIREIGGSAGLGEGECDRNTGGELLGELRKTSGSAQNNNGFN